MANLEIALLHAYAVRQFFLSDVMQQADREIEKLYQENKTRGEE